MFAQLEASLHGALDGAIPGVTLADKTLLGTLDPLPEIAKPGAPSVVLRTEWGGPRFTQRITDAVQFEQAIAVSVYVAGARVRGAERARVLAGLEEILRRLLAWRPNGPDGSLPDFDAGQVPDEFAGVWRYTISIVIPSIRLRAAPQE